MVFCGDDVCVLMRLCSMTVYNLSFAPKILEGFDSAMSEGLEWVFLLTCFCWRFC